MRRDRRCASFVVLFLAASVSACASFQTGQTKLQAVKTVGIISGIGDRISIVKTGLTGVANRDQSYPISSWNIDDLVIQQATAALNGRFQVQPVTYARAGFAELEKESVIAPVNLVRGDPVKKLVRTEVSPQGLDAYIVITKAKANFGTGGRKLEGIGLVTYGTLTTSYSRVHVLYEIRVIDGKTFDVIEKRTAEPLGDTETLKLQGPSQRVDDLYATSTGDPSKDETLRQAVTSLLTASLSATLSDMHLADIR
jgi:curli biogenesis system outer membrane secretion channel CsgG